MTLFTLLDKSGTRLRYGPSPFGKTGKVFEGWPRMYRTKAEAYRAMCHYKNACSVGEVEVEIG